jgi:predicted transcriptional regulator
MNMIAINASLLERFHRLACETQRPEADIINEALSSYLNSDAQYAEILRQRMESADRGEFASEQDVNLFFAKLVE